MTDQEVRVERLKFAATAMNTLATSSVTVGVLAPTAAFLYGATGSAAPHFLAIAAIGWILIALGLHWGAQIILGRLRS